MPSVTVFSSVFTLSYRVRLEFGVIELHLQLDFFETLKVACITHQTDLEHERFGGEGYDDPGKT